MGMRRLRTYLRKNRALLGTIFTLAWPAMLEQLLQTVVQYTDSAMVGQMGAQATAAVGLTTPVNWLVNSPMFAMGIGFLACISRALGGWRRANPFLRCLYWARSWERLLWDSAR